MSDSHDLSRNPGEELGPLVVYHNGTENAEEVVKAIAKTGRPYMIFTGAEVLKIRFEGLTYDTPISMNRVIGWLTPPN